MQAFSVVIASFIMLILQLGCPAFSFALRQSQSSNRVGHSAPPFEIKYDVSSTGTSMLAFSSAWSALCKDKSTPSLHKNLRNYHVQIKSGETFTIVRFTPLPLLGTSVRSGSQVIVRMGVPTSKYGRDIEFTIRNADMKVVKKVRYQ
jgi:hypothetical protein